MLRSVAGERGAFDPQVWAKQGQCRIVSHNSAFRRTDLVLIEADPGRVQDIVRSPGVHSVEQVVNESFRGDDGWTLTIKNGGVTARSRHRT